MTIYFLTYWLSESFKFSTIFCKQSLVVMLVEEFVVAIVLGIASAKLALQRQ